MYFGYIELNKNIIKINLTSFYFLLLKNLKFKITI